LAAAISRRGIAELTGAGNFAAMRALVLFLMRSATKPKLRATVDLITEALARGERLAALDLAEKVFGSAIADNLRANSNYLREMLATADKLARQRSSRKRKSPRVDLKNPP